jgi:hypothetical protein
LAIDFLSVLQIFPPQRDSPNLLAELGGRVPLPLLR